MSARIKVDRDEFLRLNSEGWSITKLAEHFEVNPATISRLRKQHDAGRDTRRMMTPERKATIQSMFDDGWPAKEIHRTEGADMETLRKHFPGQAWTPQQAQEHLSSVRPTFRRIRRAERFTAMSRSYGWAA